MDITEPAGWVRQFADQIAAEPSPTHRAHLLNEFRKAAQHEAERLRGYTAYQLRMQGRTTEQVAAMLGVQRHAAMKWAAGYARSRNLPWPPERVLGPHPDDVIEVRT